MRTRAALIAVAIHCAPAQAGAYTGNELHAVCSSRAMIDVGVCLGFVAGVVDGALMMTRPLPRKEQLICRPDGVTVGQMRDIVVKFLNDKPGNRHVDAEIMVGLALANAFPCGQ